VEYKKRASPSGFARFYFISTSLDYRQKTKKDSLNAFAFDESFYFWINIEIITNLIICHFSKLRLHLPKQYLPFSS
jgi:hypothetical protein